MQCPQCQAENPERARFCEDCGARLEFQCPHCGEAATPGKKFCASCGGSLIAAPATARPAASPQDYTPQHLAERILTSRSALEGERKQVTVLFADLKGSMELLADRDPEEARRILDPVLERMMDAVHRYEGTVNQVMGDGIMALFGAPLAHEDHAVRACYAALLMQAAVKQYAQELQRTEGAFIQIRVGLNSGEVVVRSIGSDLHMDYTAVGQTTHLAARMEQLAAPGSILLAPDTLRLAEGYLHVKALGPMQVKGLGEPLDVYEALGAGLARSRLQAAAGRGFTRFVGRDAELETLRRTLEQAHAGHGQVVALVGEPGVGKSRLVWEFAHSHRTQGWLVLESGSVSYGKATSYLPVIDLLKGYCRIEARDDARMVREKLTGKLLTLDRALEPTLPALLALLDVPVEDAAWEDLDPPQRRQRTLEACKRLLLRESQEQPLVLVFEDLHWIDHETQALLDSLAERIPTARVLLLVNYRPEYEHAWHRKTYYRELRLDPLPPESAEALLEALVGGDAGLAPLKRLLIERTEGNPFYLEESVRDLAEIGALVGEHGAYRLARSVARTQVPATVQAVLAARIDRLAPEDKRLLQTAAVVGKDLPYPLLQAIAELPDAALAQGLDRLRAAELLYEASLFPDLEYTFKHALTHEVAYGSLLQERRRALHARIVAAIEALYADRLAEQAERLSHHAFLGEVWAKAVVYLRQSGAKAGSRSAYREAVGHLEQALAALEHLPESRETLEQAIDVRVDLHASLIALAEFARLRDLQRETESLAEALGDPVRLARVWTHAVARYRVDGDYERGVEVAQRALGFAAAIQGDGLRAGVTGQLTHLLGLAQFELGDYRAALDCFRRTVALCNVGVPDSGVISTPSVVGRSWAAMCLAELGEFAEGTELAADAVRAAELTARPWNLMATLSCEGAVYLGKGAFSQAVVPLQRDMALCDSAGIVYLSTLVAAQLGHAYSHSGRLAEAVSLLERSVEQPGVTGRVIGESRRIAYLGEAYLLANRMADAFSVAGRALTSARNCKERGNEAWALRLLGEIAAHGDPPDIEQGEDHYRQALALAQELGMRPLVAHCHLGLGTLYHRAGRRDQAQAEFATAIDMYRSMEMSFWLTRAKAELAELSA
jgi:class 3 adenylate cyclase/tetratricopeptide (TPR) repeat protein